MSCCLAKCVTQECHERWQSMVYLLYCCNKRPPQHSCLCAHPTPRPTHHAEYISPPPSDRWSLPLPFPSCCCICKRPTFDHLKDLKAALPPSSFIMFRAVLNNVRLAGTNKKVSLMLKRFGWRLAGAMCFVSSVSWSCFVMSHTPDSPPSSPSLPRRRHPSYSTTSGLSPWAASSHAKRARVHQHGHHEELWH